YHFILGRTDDVINVAGHRLGTREIEESISSHPGVAEVAVVGVKDALKGQVAVAFVIPKESDSLEDRDVAHSQEKAIMALVDSQIGNFGRPAHVWFVSQLPKTRSGKMLRRTIQAICEVAVVGVKDALKGQVAVAFVIPKESDSLEDRDVAHSQEKAIMALVDSQIGNFGRPAHVWFVSQLPKTRSGKMLRRTIQAICEGRDPGDLTTIDDPASLDQIRQAMEE